MPSRGWFRYMRSLSGVLEQQAGRDAAAYGGGGAAAAVAALDSASIMGLAKELGRVEQAVVAGGAQGLGSRVWLGSRSRVQAKVGFRVQGEPPLGPRKMQ